MQSFDYKKLLPHVYIILGFAALALIYCYPALQGKVLTAHDNISWQAMFHEAKSYHDSTGVNPLWTNSMFSGMPTYTIGVPESNNLIGHIQTFIAAVLAKPAHFLFIAMLCFYILMSVMRMDRWIGVVGAVAYAFATYNVVLINAGHDTKMLALSYLPAVLGGLILIFRGNWISGGALMGVALALMASSLHYQVLYYALIMFGIYFIARLIITIKEKGSVGKFLLSAAIAAIVAGVSVGVIMSSFLTTQEYAKVTMRGGESELTINHDPNKKSGGLDKDYAFQWSNGIGETFCILVPYLYGGSSSEASDKAPETESLTGGQYPKLPLYWGPQPFLSGPVYFGAIICFLFVLGIFVVRSQHKWWIVAVCALTIMMSWGDHFRAFNYFLFDHMPMYNKFRAPTIVLIIPQMLFPMLGMWGLMEIIRGKVSKQDAWKQVKMAFGITAGLCVILALGGSLFFDYTNLQSDGQFPKQLVDALKDDRKNLAMKSALTSAFYISVAAGLLWAFIKEMLGKNLLIGGLGLIIAIDLISVASNYLNEENYEDPSDYEAAFQPRPVDAQIMQDPDPYYRVLDVSKNTYNDAIQAYFHKSIGGYSPAKMEIYQDLIDMQMGGAHSKGYNAQVLNMLNTKYIIFKGPQQQPVYQPNPDACGNAWFVEEVKWVKTADEEMLALNAAPLGDTSTSDNDFKPRQTAVVRATSEFEKELSGYQFGKDSAANIRLTKYGLNDLSFESSNGKDGFAVFSDIWYPYGWEAYVDGQQTPIIRANYVLRAIKVPAGVHKIEFHFRPKSFKTGNTIALFSSIILVALLGAGIYLGIRKKKEGTQEANDQTVL